MPRVSIAFFLTAVIYGLVGLSLGIFMGASGDHTLSPVHAHTNLVGWVSLAIMGGFHALPGAMTSPRLAWTTFGCLNTGILLALPTLAQTLLTGRTLIPALLIGEMLIVVGWVLFGASVLFARRRPGAAA